MKAFKRRQEAVLRGLRQHGLTDREILGMDLPAYDVARVEPGEAAKPEVAIPGGFARAVFRPPSARPCVRDARRGRKSRRPH